MLDIYKNDFLDVIDKSKMNHSKYLKNIYVLDIDFFTYEKAGYIKSWTLKSVNDEYKGNSYEEFLSVLNYIKYKYDLKVYSKYSKDLIMIYIDELDKIRGFFSEFVTYDFSLYVQLFDNFEFRSYKNWNKKLKNIDDVIEYMQKLVDEMFIPERYFYMTPNQRTRKRIYKKCKKNNNDIAKQLYPTSYNNYVNLRKSLFGGICYCPYPNKIIEHPMIAIDLKSAYIYSLLIEKHCISKINNVNKSEWEYYIDNEFESSYGIYNITYTTASNIIHCYKDIDGNNLESREHCTVTMALNNIDLKLLLNMNKVTIHKVECIYLEAYNTEYIPEYLRTVLIEEYIKKNHINKEEDKILYDAQKVILNGIYGNTIKCINSNEEFKANKNSASLTPHWGIWTTSYTKQLLLGLTLNLSGWYYSDTDSAYCLDTIENRRKIEKYNEEIRLRVKDFCDKFGYDFNELKDLGTFEIEYEIKKFKALKQKEYLFTTVDNELIVKAAGCSKEEMILDDNLYKVSKLPIGTRIFKFINDKETKCNIDGKEYKSKGSYYEIPLKNDAAYYMMVALELMTGGNNNVEF